MELPDKPVEMRGFKGHRPEKEAIGLLQVLQLTRPVADGKLTRAGVWISTPTEGSAALNAVKLHRLLVAAVVNAIAIVRVSSLVYGWITR